MERRLRQSNQGTRPITEGGALNTLEYLWPWLCDMARNSRAEAPLAIHSRSGDRDGWEWDKDAEPENAIRSLPFSRSFLKRVDHELPRSIKSALDTLRPSK